MLHMLSNRRGTTKPTTADTELAIRQIVGEGYEVAVPEQNPLIVGDQAFYRTVIRSTQSGLVGDYHVALTDPSDPNSVAVDDLKTIRFSLNPFDPALHIENAELGRPTSNTVA
jgi:hypothetical protein